MMSGRGHDGEGKMSELYHIHSAIKLTSYSIDALSTGSVLSLDEAKKSTFYEGACFLLDILALRLSELCGSMEES